MGRAKITLKRIQNDRARKLAFKNRKKGLMKKISEFPAECGGEACLIVYDGDGNAEPVTLPQDPEKVNFFLQKYDHLKKIETPLQTFDVKDFFEIKKKMVKAEISKVQKEIINVKYPTWSPCFSNMREEQLRAFIAMLNVKIRACDQRINMLKNKRQIEANYNLMKGIANMQNMVQESVGSSHSSQLNVMQNIYIPQNQKPGNENSVMADSRKQVDVPRPPEPRNQPLGEFVEWDDLDPLVDPKVWAKRLVEDDDWVNQLEEWASLPDFYFLSQNEKQGAAMKGF